MLMPLLKSSLDLVDLKYLMLFYLFEQLSVILLLKVLVFFSSAPTQSVGSALRFFIDTYAVRSSISLYKLPTNVEVPPLEVWG